MLVRSMLFGYAIIACAISFHLGASMTFFPEGALYENDYINYWLEYGVAQ
jgi:hypothetical protein